MRRISAAWLVWPVAALAAASIGLAAWPLAGRFAGESGLPPPEPVTREDAAEPASLDAILALGPFGRVIPPVEPAAKAQETELGLMLHGVVIATRPEASRAIVSGPSEPARSYGVGQAVAGDATLVEVERDRVVLDVGGRRETLSFPEARGAEPGGKEEPEDDADLSDDGEPEDDAETGGDGEPEDDAEREGDGLDALRALISDKPPARARPAKPNDDDDDDDDDDGDDGDDGDGDDYGDADDPGDLGDGVEAAVAGYRERLRDDPQRVLDDLVLVATEDGYEVGADPAEPVRRAGLEPGDLVAKVNGQQVGDIARDRRLFDEVVASGRARVEVVRDGRRMALSFPLR